MPSLWDLPGILVEIHRDLGHPIGRRVQLPPLDFALEPMHDLQGRGTRRHVDRDLALRMEVMRLEGP